MAAEGASGPNLSIAESARRVGAAAWSERALYEVLGGWAPSASGARSRIFFDAASQHHAWRSELWLERLPARLNAGPAAVVVQPQSPATEAAFGALAGLPTDSARLAVYCRVVLPHTLVGYRRWQRACSPVSDRPVARVLTLVTNDLVMDWQEACEVLMVVLSGAGEGGAGAAVAEAAASTADVEGLLLGEGAPESAG